MSQEAIFYELNEMINLLRCPICAEELKKVLKGLVCTGCKKEYLIENNIPIIFRNEALRNSILDKWEEVAKKLASISDEDNISNQEKIFDIRVWKAISALNKLDKDALILDIGCGVGSNIYLLKKLGFSRFVATEFSMERIKTAIEECGREHLFISSDCMPFSDNVFDGVISTAVIEHVEDQDFFIKEISRILKPGGLSVITSDCYIFRFYKIIGAYRSIQPIDIPPYPFRLFSQFKKYNLELLHFDGFTAIRLFTLKTLLKGIFRGIVGERYFFQIKNKLKQNNPFSSKQLTETDDPYSLPQITYNKSLINLWRVFFSQQNIFVVRKR